VSAAAGPGMSGKIGIYSSYLGKQIDSLYIKLRHVSRILRQYCITRKHSSHVCLIMNSYILAQR